MTRKRDTAELRRYTDAELLQIDLLKDDANAIPNIVKEKLPEGVKIVEVICGYKHRKFPEEKIFCCNCGASQHAFGFHVACSDGRETTLGNCCAKKPELLGPAFVKTYERHRTEKRRQSYVRDIHAAQPMILQLVHRQRISSWHAVAHGIRQGRCDLRDAMPDVFELLQQAACSNSMLKVPKRVLRMDWKPSRHDDERDEKEQKDRYDWVFNDHCYVAGPAYFECGDPVDHAKGVEAAIDRFSEIARDTDAYSTTQLRLLSVQMHAAHTSMEALIRMRTAAAEFYAATSLSGIASWVAQNRQHHGSDFKHGVEAIRSGLKNTSNGRIARRPEIAAPDLKFVEQWPMKGSPKKAA